MAQKTEFENTAEFIYKLTANRLRTKKDDLGLTLYQIAGFDTQKAYTEAESFEKEIDINILSSIFNNNRQKKKTRFLIPSTNSSYYYRSFIDNLDFRDVHDFLWGNDIEIQNYVENLFMVLYEDGITSGNSKIKNTFYDLLEVISGSDKNAKISLIYYSIKDKFNKEWIEFTKATSAVNPIFEIVDIKKSTKVLDTRKPKELDGTEPNVHLGFKKLNDALEKFTEARIVPLLIGELLNQFNK